MLVRLRKISPASNIGGRVRKNCPLADEVEGMTGAEKSPSWQIIKAAQEGG